MTIDDLPALDDWLGRRPTGDELNEIVVPGTLTAGLRSTQHESPKEPHHDQYL